MAQLLAGGHDAHGVAADGSEGGVDVLAETGVHLHGAVLIDEGSSGLCGLGVGAQDSGGLLELEDGRAGQVVGRQQTHDVGSLLSSLGSVSGHDGSHACLCGSGGRTGVSDLVALRSGGEGSGEEQLCALSHDADICVGSAQSAGAAADAQNDGYLRHDAGHLCDGGVELCSRIQHVQTLSQLCADGVVEGDDRAARLGSQLEDLDVLLNVLDGNSLAVLEDGVSLLTGSIAAGSAHRTVRKQNGVFPVIKKLGEDFSFGTL